MAAFDVPGQVFCVQPHPEFVEDYSAFLLNKRRSILGEENYQRFTQSLDKGHEGAAMARMIVDFINS